MKRQTYLQAVNERVIVFDGAFGTDAFAPNWKAHPGKLTHIAHALTDLPQRVLVRVYEQQPQDAFDNDLPAFAPETVEHLADLGVLLIGIDSASIDPANSKTLDSHQTIRRRGLRVLENLLLDDVPEGDYELIALPLKLTTADASPVRAVLREL